MAEDVFGNTAEAFSRGIADQASRGNELFTQRMLFSYLAGLQGLALTGQATGQQINPMNHLTEILGGLKAEASHPKAVSDSEEVVSKTVNDDSMSTLIEKMTSQVVQRASEQVSKTVEELVASDALAAEISTQIKQALEEVLPDVKEA